MQDGDFPFLMRDSQVLAFPVWRSKTAHRYSPQQVRCDQLADGLALVTTVVHANILECTLLRAQCGGLESHKYMHSIREDRETTNTQYARQASLWNQASPK